MSLSRILNSTPSNSGGGCCDKYDKHLTKVSHMSTDPKVEAKTSTSTFAVDNADSKVPAARAPRKLKKEWAKHWDNSSEECHSSGSSIVGFEAVGPSDKENKSEGNVGEFEGSPDMADPQRNVQSLISTPSQAISVWPEGGEGDERNEEALMTVPLAPSSQSETDKPGAEKEDKMLQLNQEEMPEANADKGITSQLEPLIGSYLEPISPPTYLDYGGDWEPRSQSPETGTSTLARSLIVETTHHQQKRKVSWDNSLCTTEDGNDVEEKLKRRRERFGHQPASVSDKRMEENVSLDDVIFERNINYHRTYMFRGAEQNSGEDGGGSSSNDSQSSSLSSPSNGQLKLLPDDFQQPIGGGWTEFRPVIIDGSNVAYHYGESIRGRKHFFCSMGIQVCVDHFTNLGCNEVFVVVPEEKLHDQNVQDAQILHELKEKGTLQSSWSRQLTSGKWVSSYDDRMILDLATKKDGIVISNDQFRDLWKENPAWHYIIEQRVVGFRFFPGIANEIRFPQDPFGRHGPSLVEMLMRSG